MKYPKPLPEALERHYEYTPDSGHCINAMLRSHYTELGSVSPQYLTSIPVKTVLKGWEMIGGLIVAEADGCSYDSTLGFQVPVEDQEF